MFWGVMMLGQRVGTKEAWEVRVLEHADREGIPKVMNRASQGIMNEKLSRWKEAQEGDSLRKNNEAFLQETRMTVRALQLKTERRLTKAHRHRLKDNVCRVLQIAIRLALQGWRAK